jgi:hypothetical protein
MEAPLSVSDAIEHELHRLEVGYPGDGSLAAFGDSEKRRDGS